MLPDPKATPGFWPPEKFCGMLRMTSPRSEYPSSRTCASSMEINGDGVVAPLIRVPVTLTTSIVVVQSSDTPSHALWLGATVLRRRIASLGGIEKLIQVLYSRAQKVVV